MCGNSVLFLPINILSVARWLSWLHDTLPCVLMESIIRCSQKIERQNSTCWAEATSSSEKIKPIALAVIKSHLPESISM